MKLVMIKSKEGLALAKRLEAMVSHWNNLKITESRMVKELACIQLEEVELKQSQLEIVRQLQGVMGVDPKDLKPHTGWALATDDAGHYMLVEVPFLAPTGRQPGEREN